MADWNRKRLLNIEDAVWRCMREAVTRGLETEGTLKGGLDVQRKAKMLYRQNHIDESAETRENRLVCAYAYAVSEENAAGGIIVTAPTCGSCGVLPSVLLYMQERRGFTDTEILHALAAGGILATLSFGWLERHISFATMMRVVLSLEVLMHLAFALTTAGWVAMVIMFFFGF